LNPFIQSKIPTFDGEYIHYKNGAEGERDPIYVPVACFVTAYARKLLIDSIQLNIERFLYCDTDSQHLKGKEIPDNVDIDNTRLGAWKIEGYFERGKFLRAKAYVEEMEERIKGDKIENNIGIYSNIKSRKVLRTHVTCAGMSSRCHVNVTFDNFENGLSVGGKLEQKRVKGGIVLIDKDYSIKL